MGLEFSDPRFVALMVALLASVPLMSTGAVAVAGAGSSGSTTTVGNSTTDSSSVGTTDTTSDECGWAVEWRGQVEFEGSSGSAIGEMGCNGDPVDCEVNTDEVECTLKDDDEDGDLICDIRKGAPGNYRAQIECEDPVTVGWTKQKVIKVVDGETVEEKVEWIPPLIHQVEEFGMD